MAREINSLESDQVVILCLPYHWITYIKPLLLLILSTGIFVFCMLSLAKIHTYSPVLSDTLLIAALLGYTAVIHRFFLETFDWALSNWIITNRRVLCFRGIPFQRNDVRFIDINRIEDIEKTKHGVWSNLCDFGEVTMNVAAAPEPIVFRYIPSPGRFVNLIESIRDQRLHKEIDVHSLQAIYGRKYRAILRGVHQKKMSVR